MILLHKELIAHLLVVERTIHSGTDILNVLYIGELCVKSSFQRQGIGRKLLNLFTKDIQNKKYDCSLLISESKNVAFYSKSNWKKLDTITIILNQNNIRQKAEGHTFGQLYSIASKEFFSSRREIFIGDSV